MIQKNFVICLTTLNNSKKAEKIAGELVRQKLVACVSILPNITSIYSWKNKIEKSREWLLMMKTQKKLVKKLEKVLLDMHPYEVAEFVVLPVESGSKKYLEWILKSTMSVS